MGREDSSPPLIFLLFILTYVKGREISTMQVTGTPTLETAPAASHPGCCISRKHWIENEAGAQPRYSDGMWMVKFYLSPLSLQ